MTKKAIELTLEQKAQIVCDIINKKSKVTPNKKAQKDLVSTQVAKN